MQRTYRKLARHLPNKTQNHKRRIVFFDATATATNAALHNQGAAVLAPLGAFGYIYIYIYIYIEIDIVIS